MGDPPAFVASTPAGCQPAPAFPTSLHRSTRLPGQAGLLIGLSKHTSPSQVFESSEFGFREGSLNGLVVEERKQSARTVVFQCIPRFH